jgi:hypothetical protein
VVPAGGAVTVARPSGRADEVSAAQVVPAGGAAQAAAQMQPMQLEVVALGSTRELDYGMVTEPDAPAAKPDAPAAPGSPPASAGQGRTRSAAFGFVEFDGQADDTTVLVNGKPMSAGQTPGKLQLPAGNYEIRMVRGGAIVDRQKVEVRPSSTTRIVVKR